MFDELKPCPFCGGHAIDKNFGTRSTLRADNTHPIVDEQLGLTANGVTGNATKAVIEAWNRRVSK